MSLAVLANHMASKGRNGDSMLVHMSPSEVAGLHALALAHGEKLTINPETGLPEAFSLKSLLPMVAGMALNAFLPGVGTAIGAALGGLSGAAGTAILVGGVTGLATGSLQKGLMAGLGAYGGAGLSEGLMNAGVSSAAQDMATRAAGEAAGLGLEGSAAADFMASRTMDAVKAQQALSPMDQLASGFGAAKEAPMAFLQNNARSLMSAASPVMADAMVPTTTQMPSAQPGDTGYIRSFQFDPYTQGLTSLGVVPANRVRYPAPAPAPAPAPTPAPQEPMYGFRDGGVVVLNGGGIVALAKGGKVKLAAGGGLQLVREFTADQYRQMAKDNPVYAGAASYAARDEASPYLSALRKYSLGRKYETLLNQGMDDAQILASLEQQRADAQRQTQEAKQLGVKDIDEATGLRKGDSAFSYLLGKDADLKGYLNEARQNYEAYQAARPQIRNLEIEHNAQLRAATPAPAPAATPAPAPAATPAPAPSGGITTLPVTTPGGGTVTGGTVTPGTTTTYTTPTTPTFTGPATTQTPTGTVTGGTVTPGTTTTYTTPTTPTFTGPATTQTPTATITGGNVTGTVDTRAALDEYQKTAPTGKPIEVTSAGVLPGTRVGGDTFDGNAKPLKQNVNAALGTPGSVNPGTPGYKYFNDNPDVAKAFAENNYGMSVEDFARTHYEKYGKNEGRKFGLPNASDEYTRMGGSLGMPEFKFDGAKLTGGSKSAYDYLMGTGEYPVSPYLPANTPLMRPYTETIADAMRPSMPTITLPRTPTRQTALNTNTGGGNANDFGFTPPGPDDITASVITTWRNRNTGETFMAPNSGYTPPGPEWERAETRPFARGGMTALGTLAAAAQGGNVQQYNLGGYSDGGRLLRGPGDGVSDSIPASIGGRQPARLADGEFVIPARIVSELGNGSTEAGARKLYAMMDRVQRARGKSVGKGKVAKDTKADKYLPA